MIWVIFAIICIVVGIAGLIIFISTYEKTAGLCALIGVLCAIIFVAVYCCQPIAKTMKVDSTHWYWTISVEQYQQLYKAGQTNESSNRNSAYNSAKSCIPNDAECVMIDVDSYVKTETHYESKGRYRQVEETYYVANYSYTVKRWVKIKEVMACGNDKEPYEPERPYPVDTPDVIGEYRCSRDCFHNYTITGIVDGQPETITVGEVEWKDIEVGDEILYETTRAGDKTWSVQRAE